MKYTIEKQAERAKKRKITLPGVKPPCKVAQRGTPNHRKRYTYSSDKAYLFVRHPILHLGMLPSVQVVVRCQDKFIV